MYNFNVASTSFSDVTATVYIPEGSDSTNPYNGKQGYGGTLTWTEVPYGICGENVYWSYDETAQKLRLYGSGAPSDAYGSGNDVPWAGLQDGIITIEVEEGIDYLPSYTFEFCRKATTIKLPETLKNLQLTTFYDCESLNNLVLPSSLEQIGDDSGYYMQFVRCNKLTDVYYLGTEEAWAQVKNSDKIVSNNSGRTFHFLQKMDATATCTEPGLQAYYTFDDTSVYGSMYDKSGNVITSLATVPALGHRVIAEQGMHVDPLTVSNTSAVPFTLTDGTYYSNNKGSNSSSQIQITAQYPCSLTLNYGVSSEDGCDKLTILHNNTQKDFISGTVSNKTMTLSLAANDVVIVRYSKDGSVDRNQDRGWVTLIYEAISAEPGDDIPAYLVTPDCANAVVCAYCQTVVAEALEHTPVTDAAVAPTCTETGLTEGTHCSGCGTVLTAPTEVAATGHTEVIDAAVEETCTEDGLAEGSHCSVCNEVIVAQEVIPAQHTVENGICTRCQVYGTCGENLTWMLDENGILTIAGTGDMTNYTDNGSESWNFAPWDSRREYVKTLIVEDGVTSIGNDTFGGCINLNDVILPDSLTSIGIRAFVLCRNLSNITIPDCVTTISDGAFQDCTSLSSITFSDSLVNIGMGTFMGCISLRDITIPNGVTHIGDGAFRSCSSLTNIILPDTVTCIDAFYGCSNLSSITIPDAVTNIGTNAFAYCSNLRSITIPASVTNIDDSAFDNCVSLDSITFEGNAPVIGNAFYDVTATAYYPANNKTWTSDVMQDYGGDITWLPYGYVENRVTLDAVDLEGQTSVWIDGTEYEVQTIGDSHYVDLPDGNARTMVTYTYNVGSDVSTHTRYPVGMKVWMLSSVNGFYTVTRQEVFDDILEYSGMSIRVTGKKGIRMITSIERDKKNALVSDGLAGYTLKEYGTAIAWASQLSDTKPLALGNSYVKSNYAYKKGVADPVFAYSGSLMQYTNVLVNFSDEQCKNDIALRPYMILEDAEGNAVTLYGGIVYRSIGYIAYQNRNVFEPGTDEYKFIWNIIQYVYGDVYDDEFIHAWTPSIK